MSDTLHTSRACLRATERKWGNPGTHLTSHHTSLSWQHSLKPSPPPRYITIKPKFTSNPCQLFTIFSSLLSTPPPLPQSSFAADDFAVFFDKKIGDIHSSFKAPHFVPVPITHPLFLQFLSPHRHRCFPTPALLLTTCALDPIPSSLLQALTQDILSPLS